MSALDTLRWAADNPYAAVDLIPMWAIAAGTLLFLVAVHLVGRRLFGRGLAWIVTRPVRRIWRAVLDRVLQTASYSYASAFLAVALAVLGPLAIVGIAGLLVTDASLQTSSAPVVTTFFELSTNLWVFALLLLWGARETLLMADRVKARQEAGKTGYSYRSIRRWAEEAHKPDLDTCRRVLVETGRNVESVTEDIYSALVEDTEIEWDFTPPSEPADTTEPDETSDDAGDTTWVSFDDAFVEDTTEPDDDDDGLGRLTKYRLMKLDFGAAFDPERVLWRFGIPTVVTFLFIVGAYGTWIQWWAYLVLLTVSATVGAVYYYVKDRLHRRRLGQLRHQPGGAVWTDAAVLVKRAETPERTLYYGFLAGKTYASPDPDGLAETLAERACELVNDGYRRPSPAIEERWAWLLRRYLTSLRAWQEEVEKTRIMDALVDAVDAAPENVLPKRQLVQTVVEHDRRYILRGKLHVGFGFDPRLVAAVYTDLVEDHALVEHDVQVPTPDGDPVEMTAVSLGDEPLPPDVAQLRAEFSTWFSDHHTGRYSLPDVDLDTDDRPHVVDESFDYGELSIHPATAD